MDQGQIIDTPFGQVRLRLLDAPEQLEGLSLDEGFGRFERYRSFFPDMASLERQLARPGALLAVALQGRAIVAYALLRPAMADERWAQLADPPMMELIVEAARNRRGGGLMKPLVAMVVQRPENDERIVYLVAYCWTWDLDDTGKTMAQYRQTLKSLVEGLGLREYPTNEPNVALRPENLFMARLGAKIEADRACKRRFSNLLFGIQEDW